MPTLMFPTDERYAALGAGLSNAIGQVASQQRQKRVVQALQAGESPEQAIMLAQGDPQAMALVDHLVKLKTAQADQGLKQAETQRATAQTKTQEVEQQKLGADTLKAQAETRHTDLLNQSKGLEDDLTRARTAQAKAATVGDYARARNENLRAQQIQQDMETNKFMLKRLQDTFPDLKDDVSGARAAQGTAGTSSGTSTTSTGTTTTSTGTATTTSPEARSNPAMDADSGNVDMLKLSIIKAERARTAEDALGGASTSMRFGKGPMSMTISRPQRNLTQSESNLYNEAYNLMRTLKLFQDAALNPKANSGPIAGRIQEIRNKLRTDPRMMDDPNIMMEALGGHEILNTLQGLGNVRGGIQIGERLKSILADIRDNKPLAMEKIRETTRILSDSVGIATMSFTNARKSGIDLDVVREIDKMRDNINGVARDAVSNVKIGNQTISLDDVRTMATELGVTDDKMIDLLKDSYKAGKWRKGAGASE